MVRLITLPIFTLLLGVLFSGFNDLSEAEKAPDDNEIAYPEHLTGIFTGGFGEETCRSCHFDYDLNPEGGSLSVSGIPEKISEGEQIEIQIEVKREELGAAGFQLSARYEDGSQAGSFDIEKNERLMFSDEVPDSLQYVQHMNEGTNPSEENKNRWMGRWQAPESPKGPIIFNIAANAANGDQSEFGDYIYADEIEVGITQ
ncbi:MAG: choice-of-anchor V domain-containing protein [Bacteroidota bacterium]